MKIKSVKGTKKDFHNIKDVVINSPLNLSSPQVRHFEEYEYIPTQNETDRRKRSEEQREVRDREDPQRTFP